VIGDRHIIDRDRFDAVIFDMDGVMTDTARVHASAWRQLFDAFLQERAEAHNEPFEPFSDSDYRRYVDGKARYDGVRDFLASRSISIPEGESDAAPGTGSVHALGNLKDRYFLGSLAGCVESYPTAVRFVSLLQDAGFLTAVTSASRNAETVLARAGLAELFPVRVDGVEAARLDLAGKPAPDVFLEAAKRLGVEPGRAVVVEDAVAGVEAGKAGGFGLVVGVNRADQAEALSDRGADIVVDDLAVLSVRGLARATPAVCLIGELPSALDCWDEIAARVGRATPVVFLDYDGTLTPIVERPEDAHLPPETREVLLALSEQCPVVIVSGRDAAFVVAEVGLSGVYYLGSHGFEVVAPAGCELLLGRADEFGRFLPSLERAQSMLEPALARIPGARVERKRYAIAVHYRQVADKDVSGVEAIVDRALARLTDLRKSGGKKIFELRPDIDWDKGRAVRWMIGALGLDGAATLPVYVGDDLTDEDAFAELSTDGVTIVVGAEPRTSAAHYRLENPSAVTRWLGLLAGAIDGSDTP